MPHTTEKVLKSFLYVQTVRALTPSTEINLNIQVFICLKFSHFVFSYITQNVDF